VIKRFNNGPSDPLLGMQPGFVIYFHNPAAFYSRSKTELENQVSSSSLSIQGVFLSAEWWSTHSVSKYLSPDTH
jgi:hypothetical protein